MSDFFIGKNQSLENYLREIGEVKLLTPDEEIELAKRIKQNDQRALKKLVSANLRFVVSVAKSYQNYGLSLEDLINEGNLGLMKHVDLNSFRMLFGGLNNLFYRQLLSNQD